MADTDETAALKAQVETLRSFLTDHPEVAAELGVSQAEPAGPPDPLTFHGIIRDLVRHIPGIDDERREQMAAAIDDHEAATVGAPEPDPTAGSTAAPAAAPTETSASDGATGQESPAPSSGDDLAV
jgi:hypothetical protein